MRADVMRQFGVRLRTRIKRAGFSNVSELLRRLRISHSLVSALINRKAGDVGLGKVAEIAIMLGMKPSELVAEMDDLLLAPAQVSAKEAKAYGLIDWPTAWDPLRLSVVADVVEGWVDEAGDDEMTPAEIGREISRIYGATVTLDPSISLVDLRCQAMADVYGVELPNRQPRPRGRGRPSTADAA